MAFLRDVLADGPLAATEVFQRGKDEGHAEKTIKRAKGSLGVRSVKATGRWVWEIPPQDPGPLAPPCPGPLGLLGPLPGNKVANCWPPSSESDPLGPLEGKGAKGAKDANGHARRREPTLLDVLGSEEAVVQAFVDAFDATEITGEVVA